MKYFEVPLASEGSRYLGNGQLLVWICIKANDLSDAEKKLERFKLHYPFPAYLKPREIFWLFGWMAFFGFPLRHHDVCWQLVDSDGNYCQVSASQAELRFA